MNINQIVESVLRDILNEKKDSICGFEHGRGYIATKHRNGTPESVAKDDAKRAISKHEERKYKDDSEDLGLHDDTPERRAKAKEMMNQRREEGLTAKYNPRQTKLDFNKVNEAIDKVLAKYRR